MLCFAKGNFIKLICLSWFWLLFCVSANLKEDVEPVTPTKTYGDQPIVDTGIFGSGWENPFKSDAFGGLFDNLEGNFSN